MTDSDFTSQKTTDKSASDSEEELEKVKEILAKGTADSPRFERVGSTDDGAGLYVMNSLDIVIYMAGLKQMQEGSTDE